MSIALWQLPLKAFVGKQKFQHPEGFGTDQCIDKAVSNIVMQMMRLVQYQYLWIQIG